MSKPKNKNRTFPRKASYQNRAIAEAPVQKDPEIGQKPLESAFSEAQEEPPRASARDDLESLSEADLGRVADEAFERLQAEADPYRQAAEQSVIDRVVGVLAGRGVVWSEPTD